MAFPSLSFSLFIFSMYLSLSLSLSLSFSLLLYLSFSLSFSLLWGEGESYYLLLSFFTLKLAGISPSLPLSLFLSLFISLSLSLSLSLPLLSHLLSLPFFPPFSFFPSKTIQPFTFTPFTPLSPYDYYRCTNTLWFFCTERTVQYVFHPQRNIHRVARLEFIVSTENHRLLFCLFTVLVCGQIKSPNLTPKSLVGSW